MEARQNKTKFKKYERSREKDEINKQKSKYYKNTRRKEDRFYRNKAKNYERSREKEETKKTKEYESSREKDVKNEKPINYFRESENHYICKGLITININESNSSILKKYENLNEAYLRNLNKSNIYQKYNNIISNNMEKTPMEDAKKYGEQLYSLLEFVSNNKSTISSNYPNLSFNKSLSDDEFLSLTEEAVQYALATKTPVQIQDLKIRFANEKKNIIELFQKEKIIKDILENSILSILINEYDENELGNHFSFLNVDDVSACPLINLPFSYNKKSFDLNKENIIEEAISNIPLLAFFSTMKKFIKNFKYKRNELKEKIGQYINNHEIYFALFQDNIQGITIHKGATYINLKYIKEYMDKENVDKRIIIRAKILQIYFHELNNGLLRELDEEKNANFFNNSITKDKKKNFKLKSIKPVDFFFACK